MTRRILIATYLASAAFTVISLDANGENVEFLAVAIWAVSSVLLGWTTGQLSFAVLAYLAVLFAIPFGYPNNYQYNYQYSEPLPTWWPALILASVSAVLIFLTALVKRLVEAHRRRLQPPGRRS